jgi:crotonobetaine/carnitine-CoA ligase
MEKNNDILGRRTKGDFPVFRTVEEVIDQGQKILSPDSVFIQMTSGENLTAGEYFENLHRVSNMFVNLGIRKDDHVAVYLSNCVEYAYLYMALGRLGAVIVPINQFLKGDSLQHIIHHSDVRLLVTSKELFEEKVLPIAASLDKVQKVMFVGEAVETDQFKIEHYEDFRIYSKEFKQPWEVRGENIQAFWYTSGTTGLPKGAVVTQEGVLYRTSFFADYFKLTPSDTMYFILPMYHIPYFCWGISMAMIRGCKLVNVTWFSASKFWEHISTYKGTVVFSTGTIIPILLKQKIGPYEREGRDLVRLWAGWPVDEPKAATERWPKTKFMEAFGLSEYPLATITSYENPELGTAGRPTPYTDLKICDPETGDELPQGSTGEIVMRSKLGPTYMMLGYYNSPEDTGRTIKDDWCYSGDLGFLDKKGLLHFADRYKDYVRVGGENVPSAQLEAIIRKHPKIEEIAVVGVKGELGHGEIIAHVIVKEGEQLSPQEFFDFCQKEMAYYMIPRYLYFQKEFPKTAMLKIQKFKLREEGLPEGYFDRKSFLKTTK